MYSRIKTRATCFSDQTHSQESSSIIQNGKPICECLVILQYIDEVGSTDTCLLFDDAHNRAKLKQDSGLISLTKRKMWASKGEEQEGGKEDFTECVRLLENELGDNIYFHYYRKRLWQV
ncbi:glutathione S-transferase U19-like [Prosopis cineraria]|uniref:glutathione S-transferase U19-like n=1 Tax=Prosopis cineraria TaxID=364024 RepID=UPI0024108146|nr:glutathione S-transferase U19-like [Prosopis cineraria]